MVASGKQHIIGVDGVDDVDEYNNYAEMQLFTDFSKKISVVKKNLPKDILPWEQKGVKGKVVTGQLFNMECLCKCVSVGLHLCMCVRLHLCVCVRLHGRYINQ